MIFPTVNKIPSFILEKLDLLFRLLKERKKEYEVFAGNVSDKHLKRTVLTLAQETNQYAMELGSQIESMGGKAPETAHEEEAVMANSPVMMSETGDILKSCEISETKMIVAYRNVLNEPFLHENLRRLIRTQLNGITYAFMQLRLLNSSLRSAAPQP